MQRRVAANVLDIDGSSCGFGSVCSHPAKIIKGANKIYLETRFSPQRLARRLKSPLFLPAASSYLP
jgi:hypothetical protein